MAQQRNLVRRWFGLACCLALLLGQAGSAVRGDDEFPPPDLRDGPLLRPHPGWPVWLKDHRTGGRTDETSGIAFIGRDREGKRCFFLADDVGFLHFCRVSQIGDTNGVDLELERVTTDRSLLEDLAANEKWDFEALAVDPAARNARRGALPDTLTGILCVEGRGTEYLETTRVLSVRFVRDGQRDGAAWAAEERHWRIESRGDAFPGAKFWYGQVSANSGLEGAAIGDRFRFLGLESLESRGELNLRGTVLYIYDPDTDQVAAWRTKPVGIHSISGLAAVNDSVLVLLDRNRQSICVLRLDLADVGRVTACYRFQLDLPAPGGYRYAVPSVEGIALDDEGDIWCVTDPWRGHYRAVGEAPETLHVYLAAEMPMIYRFPGKPVWQTAGLDHLWGGANPTPGR